ncbi:LysR family transcriptional regulator [Polaromonas sp.]|uniref:LysR family transcriptional regulator n=1 Tax=Polaromonas sp. TaxID=1869339 RepID=UPI003BA8C68D
MNLTLRQLRAFAAVADAHSFTEAAAQLHLTQSALSVLVRELERDLGVRVLDRTTRRVSLTEAGRDFYPSVQRILNDLGNAVTSVADLRDKKKGILRLAAPQLMACTLIPQVIAAYRERFPNVEVRVTDTLPEHLMAGLVTGEVELAIGPDQQPADSAVEVESKTLFRDRHWLICRPDHALARRKKVCWGELSPYPFIAPTQDFMRRLRAESHADLQGVLPFPVQAVSYMTTALGMVAAGLGLTVCPTYAASLVKGYGLQMVPLEQPQFFREVCVYSPANRALSPVANSFIGFIVQYAQNREHSA